MKPVAMVEVGPPLPADSAPPMFVTTPMVAAPLVVVEHVQPGPIAEHAVPPPAKTRTSFLDSWTFFLIWPEVTLRSPLVDLFQKLIWFLQINICCPSLLHEC